MANAAKRKAAAGSRLSLTEEVKRYLRFIGEQTTVTKKQLGSYAGVRGRKLNQLVADLAAEGWLSAEEVIVGYGEWLSLERSGMRAAGLDFDCHRVHYRTLFHLHEITKARLAVEAEFEVVEWRCERLLRSRPMGHVPDAVAVVLVEGRDGKRIRHEYAIEAELSAKSVGEFLKIVRSMEENYDKVLYFGAPGICDLFDRLRGEDDLSVAFPKLLLRAIKHVERSLKQDVWRVAGDPSFRSFKSLWNASLLALDGEELDVLDLVGIQGTIPFDQLLEFLGIKEGDSRGSAKVEAMVVSLVDCGLIYRAQPLVGDTYWIWLSGLGLKMSRVELDSYTPRLHALERRRAINAARLSFAGAGERWIGKQLPEPSREEKRPLPHAIVERDKVDEDGHTCTKRIGVSVFLFAPSESILKELLAEHLEAHDGVIWFYSTRSRGPLENLAMLVGRDDFEVRPLPDPRLCRKSGLVRHQKSAASKPRLRNYLAGKPPSRMRALALDALHPQVLIEISAMAEVERAPQVRKAWRRVGRGPQTFLVDTDLGAYRVTHSGHGWSADLVERAELFVAEDGSPLDLRGRADQWASDGATEWAEIENDVLERALEILAPARSAGKGSAVTHPDGAVLNGIVWALRNGKKLSALTEDLRYGSAHVTYKRLRRWQEQGLWSELVDFLRAALPDGTRLDWPRLSQRPKPPAERQQQLMARAIVDPESRFTIRGHAEYWGIYQASARSDFSALIEQGLLTREKEGKTYIYTPAPGLGKRLKELAG